ncbi:MAG: hypothetical protein Q7J57_00755 [Gemmobacter sp.]|nr:hypothetical protein [Gemmobacter sp.]
MRAGDVILALMDPGTVWLQTHIDEGRGDDLDLGLPAEIGLRSLLHAVLSCAMARTGIKSDRVNAGRRVWVS